MKPLWAFASAFLLTLPISLQGDLVTKPDGDEDRIQNALPQAGATGLAEEPGRPGKASPITRAAPPSTQSRWSASKPFVNSLGMKFVPVPGTDVLISVWETRVKDYGAFASAVSGVDDSWKNPGYNQDATHPVVKADWDDAKRFCAWLTGKERREGRLTASQGYRLPTDSEWSWGVGIGNRETGATPKEKDGKLTGVYPWGTQWPPPTSAGNDILIPNSLPSPVMVQAQYR